jgi:hypothetical protein
MSAGHIVSWPAVPGLRKAASIKSKGRRMRANHVKRAQCLVAVMALVVVIQGGDSVTQGKVQPDAQPAVLQTAPAFLAANASGNPPRHATPYVGPDKQTSYPMGYVASFGAFSLPEQPIPPPPPAPPPPPIDGHAMFLARKQSLPGLYCFYDGPLTFEYFATDDWLGVTGWMYKAQTSGAGLRHFLFGAETVGWCQGVAQRYVVVYDQWWCPVNCVCANYGEACEGLSPKAGASPARNQRAATEEPSFIANNPRTPSRSKLGD